MSNQEFPLIAYLSVLVHMVKQLTSGKEMPFSCGDITGSRVGYSLLS
uniref:Uncharacterized protein n=1 Tax=Vitis vinifera TaxID=29760 RepID=F6GVJ7_VITVI